MSDSLKSTFFRESSVGPAETELQCGTETDAEVVGSVIPGLYPVLRDLKPVAAAGRCLGPHC
jgi:hypothetical protein